MNSRQDSNAPANPDASGLPDCTVCDLTQFGLIRVSGADSRTFLQGQLTNDVNLVTPELAQLNSYCSPKGRMLVSFWIFQRGDDLYLQLPRERLAAILKRLQMFVMRSQVTLADVSDELMRIGLTGGCADELLPAVPGGDKATLTRDELTIVRLPGDRPRFEAIGPATAITALRAAAAGQATPVDADFWALMDIRAGIPVVLEDTVEAFVPQMTNLQLIGGVSFTKGCYTGQEVVARMQYLGKLKRRMYRVRIDTAERPAAGAELFSPSSESGQGAGRIVDAAPAPQGGFEALAVLQISSAEANDVRLGDAAGPTVELLDLPYAFATAEG